MGDPSASTRDQLWRLLFFAAAGLLLVGLAFDGWSPGTGTSGDVAHSVVVVGGTVLVLAAVMLAVSPILFRRSAERGGWRVVQVAVPVLVVGVVGPAMVAAAASSTRSEPTAALPGAVAALAGTGAAHEDTPHEHTDAASTPAAATGAAAPATPGQALGSEITGNSAAAAGAEPDHGHGTALPEQPLDPATRNALGQQLVTARNVAMTYPTVASALAAGYIKVTTFVPLIGAHYLNFALTDDVFDPAQPEMLLYDGTDPGSKIVGLSYFVAAPDGAPPEGFAGPNDHWHQHIGLCVKNAVVVGGEKISAEECKKRGGNKVGLHDLWMVHAWVVPGWDSPQGVFSPEHLGLV